MVFKYMLWPKGAKAGSIIPCHEEQMEQQLMEIVEKWESGGWIL